MFSSLTASEEFHLTGTLSGTRIEGLLDKSEALDKLDGVNAHVEEAMTQFPAEDFLSGVIERLHAIAKRLRGDNKAELLGVIEALDDVAQTTFNASDYGRSELREALKVIQEAGL